MVNILSTISSKKSYFIAGIVIVLFLAGSAILLQQPNTELTYKVKRENLVDNVQVSGTYSTASQVQVTSPTNGIIDKIFVSNGDLVKKGDQLFHVQSTATVDQQKSAYANYLAANSALLADNANLYSLQSAKDSAWKKFIDLATNSTYQNSDGSPNTTNRVLTELTTAEDNWLAGEANYKNQQSVIAKDQAALSAAAQLYGETQSVSVTAPVAGSVVNLLVKVGDQVAAAQPTGQPVLIIANLGNPYITVDISEDYVTRIASGQKVAIVFDALKDKTFTGVVDTVASVGTSAQGVVTYSARIGVNNLPLEIKANMTALVTIETLRKDNVVDVPDSAIITKSGISYVELANTHKLLPVEIGIKGTIKTEIVNGLAAGVVIVASPSSD